MPVSFADILAAQSRLLAHALPTPLLSHPDIDAAAGRPVWIKAEALQKTGSFKYRGARAALSLLTDEDLARGVVAVSSGNHAQGVALAAAEMGTTATILMPRDAPRPKIEGVRALGAEIVFYDRETDDRLAMAEALSASTQRPLIRPYDDPAVIAGQGTVGLEIAEHLAGMEIGAAEVLVPTGGGGLASGIALALAGAAPDLTVRTVEPDAFDDTARSLATGTLHHNAALTGSICDAILTPSPGVLTLPILSAHAGPGLTVSDAACLRAMRLAFGCLELTLEPAGAAALAAAIEHPGAIKGDAVIVVASGGNVDLEILTEALMASG